MEDISLIDGAEQLVAVFGYWPTFHDAEVLWVRLDRRAVDEGSYGPKLEAMVHAFEITPDVGPDKYFVLRHHVLVHLRFRDVVELRLEGFNHQNSLMGIEFTDLRDSQLERVKWAVRFDAAFGVDASFQCRSVEIVSVVPCSKDGEPITAPPASHTDS